VQRVEKFLTIAVEKDVGLGDVLRLAGDDHLAQRAVPGLCRQGCAFPLPGGPCVETKAVNQLLGKADRE
jgi:hypothetical protein